MRARACGVVVLAGLLAAATTTATARGQVVVAPPTGGLGQPSIPARGDWLQVLTATDRWLVLQNERGQQFPVAVDAVRLFVMRWPTTPDRIAPECLVEVTGVDLGTNQVAATHVDVYRGDARALVTPTVQHLVGFNRVVTPFDVERQNVLGMNWQYLLSPQEMLIPPRLHVVAPAVSAVPLQLATGGNNAVVVLGSAAGLSMTDVTPGRAELVRPGDMAFLVPDWSATTPRSLALDQLVIFKLVPLDQFVP